MITKTLTYMTYGTDTEPPKEVTRSFNFHLSKMEVIRYAAKHPGGIKGKIQDMAKETDEDRILQTLEDLVMMSFVVRDPDGEGFDKDPDLLKKFKKSPAYAALFDEFMEADSTASAMADFINGIFPAEMVKASEEAIAAAGGDVQKALENAAAKVAQGGQDVQPVQNI